MPGYAVLSEPWWIALVWILLFGHITNICTTLYLHRSATHGGVKFHPIVEHAMRFWLWATSGAVTKEWVAVHRKHHAYADREGDPHSPTVEGLANIALTGVFFYRRAARDKQMVEKYGKGCPDDWIERNVYSSDVWRSAGVFSMMIVDIWLFGFGLGLLVWSAMTIWMPIMGNIINGIGHAIGYRTFGTADHSRNIYPWGIWILGEELHNNHHADPKSAKFKAHWWEFDIGWFYIRLLQPLGLAEVVYARDASPEEFNEQYYGAESGSSGRLDRAVARIQRAKEDGIGRIEGAWEEARGRLEQVRAGGRARLDQAKDEALARLERVSEEGRAGLSRVKTRRMKQLEAAKREALAELDRAREAARARIVRAAETLAGTGRPATD